MIPMGWRMKSRAKQLRVISWLNTGLHAINDGDTAWIVVCDFLEVVVLTKFRVITENPLRYKRLHTDFSEWGFVGGRHA